MSDKKKKSKKENKEPKKKEPEFQITAAVLATARETARFSPRAIRKALGNCKWRHAHAVMAELTKKS